MPPREPTGPPAPGPQTHDAEPFTQVPEQGVRRRSGSQGDQRQLPEKCSAEHRGLGGGGGCAWGRGAPPPPASRSAPWLPSAVTEAAALRSAPGRHVQRAEACKAHPAASTSRRPRGSPGPPHGACGRARAPREHATKSEATE